MEGNFMANYFNPCNCQGFYNNPDRQTTPGQFSPGNVNGSPSVTALPPLPTGYPTGQCTALCSNLRPLHLKRFLRPLYGTWAWNLAKYCLYPGYLKQHIGARVKVEFLIGTNMLVTGKVLWLTWAQATS